MPLPCILFEDDDLLVVNKPAGIATHRTGELEPWGIVELLESRADPPVKLGVHQRLDRETSGVIVFSKSAVARKKLGEQFEGRKARKRYRFTTSGKAVASHFQAAEPVDGKPARTAFCQVERLANGLDLWEACPETGRTHQVRIHATQHGIPITGDGHRDGGSDGPLLLHAARLGIEHPTTAKRLILEAPLPGYFSEASPRARQAASSIALREALIAPEETNAYRLLHKDTDGWPGWTLDRMGDWLYLERFSGENGRLDWSAVLSDLPVLKPRGVILAEADPKSPRQVKRLAAGENPPKELIVRENGISYRMDLLRPGATGLFLDQRENRRRIRQTAHEKRVLNCFSYTCGFSVAAVRGGAGQTTNVDLSRPALEWGKTNFQINGLNPHQHQFWAMDIWEALARLRKKREVFGMILIDPPSSSRSKSSGHFAVQKDFPRLVQEALPLLEPGGWLFCSSNLATWKSGDFLDAVEESVRRAKRRIVARTWIPQPFDFPAIAGHPPYFKSAWLQVE